MKTKLSLLLILLLMSMSCVTTQTPVYNPPAEDQPVKVAVKYFRIDGEMQKNNYEGNTNFGKQIAENIASTIQEKGYTAIATDNIDNIDSDYIVKGEIIRMDTGIYPLRVLGLLTFPAGMVLCGIGSGSFSVNSRFMERETSRVILDYDNKRKMALVSLMRDDENLMQELCLEVAVSIAEDVAEEIEENDSKLPPANISQAEK